MKHLAGFVAFVLLLLVPARAWAHKPSDAYVSLDADGARIHARVDIALRDLDYAIGIDGDGDGKITWSEVQSHAVAIQDYALVKVRLASSDGACTMTGDPKRLAIASHSDGTYAVLTLDATCPGPVTTLALDYSMFFDVDPQHRGIVRIDANGMSRTHTMSARETHAEFDLRESGRSRQLGAIVKQGIFHIWEGYDHILFLLALLLPSVLRREGNVWQPVPALRPALLDVLRIVTAFTVAHSITLSLAALGVVTLPSRLVESAIAASVVLAAANNLYPILRHDRWMAAFLLGLMHGFGFSATLMDMDLPRSNLVLTLFGFNAGVEIGQLAIVLVFVPTAYLLRRKSAYRRGALVIGSVGILIIATIWLVERAFVIRIIS